MNKRLKSMAIMMALIITISVFTSVAATTTVAAHTTTSTKIASSNRYPAVGQTITFTVTLKAGTTGLSKPVKIWHTFNGVRYEDGTHTTANGVYKYNQAFASKGQRIYYARFAGDSMYASSTGTVTVYVGTKTTLTLTISKSQTVPGETYVLSGYLKDANGHPLADKKVQFYYKPEGGTKWTAGAAPTTNSKGYYSLPDHAWSTFSFYTVFGGNSAYAYAKSKVVTVNVRIPTTTRIAVAYPTPTVGQTDYFNVMLAAGTSLLSKPVKIWHTLNGVRYEDGTHNTVDGQYAFSQAFGSKGQRIYHAEFAGDSQYAASSGTETVNVQDKATTLTLTTSRTTAYVGQFYTLSGYLKDANGKGIPDATIRLYYKHAGESSFTYWLDLKTDSNGYYQRATSDSKTISHYTSYGGSSTYPAAKSNTVTVDVQKIPTTTTITASPTNPTNLEIVTFTVIVKAGNTGLSGPVAIWYTKPDGTQHDYGTYNTVDGVFTFNRPLPEPGQWIYHATFAGDSQHAASSGTVTVNVILF